MRGHKGHDDDDADAADDDQGGPLEPPYRAPMLGDDGDAVDDDLKQQLDLKGPEDHEEE